jgi:hypothetical protein
MTRSRSFKYVFALGACILAMLALVPVSFAGEDDGDDDSAPAAQVVQSSGGGGGGGDTGSASGGVQTGFGGMATVGGPGHGLAIELAGGGVLLLAAAGGLARRRVFDR